MRSPKAYLHILCVNVFSLPGCVPWPCHSFLGQDTPEVCLHYVDAPRNIQTELEDNQDPTYDAVTVSWNPSQYGIENEMQHMFSYVFTG